MNGQMDGWTDEWLAGWTDRQAGRQTYRWINRQTDGWMDTHTDKQIQIHTTGPSKHRRYIFYIYPQSKKKKKNPGMRG
jgi:hypothetical protein